MVAEACGGAWPETARKAASALAGGDIDEVSRTELLLSDIRDIFAAPELDEISSMALIERLIAIVPRPWAEFGRSGKPITPNKLARLLSPLGIGPHLIGSDRLAGYRRARFDDAFERYLAPISPLFPLSNLSGSQTSGKPGDSELSQPLTPKQPERFENRGNPRNSYDLRGREVWKGGYSELSVARDGSDAKTPPSSTPANRGAPVYAVLGPARPGQRCSICDGSIGVKRIKYAGEEHIWHEACAKRRLAAVAGTPSGDVVASARGSGAVFALFADGTGFTLDLRRVADSVIRDALSDAISANYEPILDLLRREAGSQ